MNHQSINQNLYSTPSRSLLKGAPRPRPSVKEVLRRWWNWDDASGLLHKLFETEILQSFDCVLDNKVETSLHTIVHASICYEMSCCMLSRTYWSLAPYFLSSMDSVGTFVGQCSAYDHIYIC